MRYEESAEQRALFYWANLLVKKYPQLDELYHVPNGGFRNAREARRFKLEGVKKGVLDINLDIPKQGSQWPHEPGYHGLRIEMKSEKGKLTIDQNVWIARHTKNGYKAVVCRSWTEAAKVICDYLDIPREGL